MLGLWLLLFPTMGLSGTEVHLVGGRAIPSQGLGSTSAELGKAVRERVWYLLCNSVDASWLCVIRGDLRS